MADQSHTWHCVDLAQRLNGVLGSSCSSLTASDGVLTPVEDLAELRATLEFVQTTLQPEVAAGADAVAASDPAAAICIEGVRNTLDELTLFVQDYVLARRRTPLTVTQWRDQRIYLYQLDFLLKQKIDQFAALFLQGRDAAQLIEDYDGQQLWINAFGSRITMVPWHVFWKLIVTQFGSIVQNEEKTTQLFLDFTRNNYVSAYEFSVFLKWFGVFPQSLPRMLDAVHGGLISGFVPALEAKMLLEEKRNGTFLIRLSKTRPGSFAVTFVDSRGAVKHCVRAGAAVALSNGLARRIEDVPRGAAVVAAAPAPAHADGDSLVAVHGPRVSAHLDQGARACVSVRLEDGRRLLVTPDHRLLAIAGDGVPRYVEAARLTAQHRVVCAALAAVLDEPADDAAVDFAPADAPLAALRAGDAASRERALAFARLAGAALAAGDGRRSVLRRRRQRASGAAGAAGAAADARSLAADAALVLAAAPRRSALDALLAAPARCRKRGVPLFLLDERCPRSVRREFVAAWLGRALLVPAACLISDADADADASNADASNADANAARQRLPVRRATRTLVRMLATLADVPRASLGATRCGRVSVAPSAVERVAKRVGVRHAACTNAALALLAAHAAATTTTATTTAAAAKSAAAARTASLASFCARVRIGAFALALRVASPVEPFENGAPQRVFDLSVPKHTSFVADGAVMHNCLLYSVQGGVTLRNPPTLYASLKEFASAHTSKLKYPRMAVWADLIVQAEARAKGLALPAAGEHHFGPRSGSTILADGAGGASSAAAAADADGAAEKEDDNNCIVCWSAQIDTVFVACGHMACCRICAANLSPQICPVCRQAIQQVVQVFKAV